MEFKKIIINNEVTNYSISSNGTVRNDITGKFLKGSRGYNHWYYQLSLKNRKSNFQADLLMQVFLPEKPSDNAVIIHKDNNPYNNNIENLYWYNPICDDNWKQIIIDGEETPFYVNKLGEVKNSKTGNILKGNNDKTYKYYTLRYNNKQKIKSGHRLVAEAFLPNPNNLPVVHHKDHNRLNNQLENLEWTTIQENAADTLPRRKKESFYCLTYNSLPNELWVTYKDTYYEISNFGRVRNLKQMKITKGTIRDDGYTQHSICGKNILTHVLVVQTFIRDLNKGEEINHINHIKTDNRLENLEIVSHKKNMQEAGIHGKCGAKRVGRFDSEGNLLQVYPSASAAARDIGILPSSMRNIINYRNGKRKNEVFKYIDEGSSTKRDKNPEAQNT